MLKMEKVMKKVSLILLAAAGAIGVNVAPASASTCLGEYLNDLNTCGGDTACAVSAYGSYILCLEENGQGPCANGGCES